MREFAIMIIIKRIFSLLVDFNIFTGTLAETHKYEKLGI